MLGAQDLYNMETEALQDVSEARTCSVVAYMFFSLYRCPLRNIYIYISLFFFFFPRYLHDVIIIGAMYWKDVWNECERFSCTRCHE